jgi:hypothetical protein
MKHKKILVLSTVSVLLVYILTGVSVYYSQKYYRDASMRGKVVTFIIDYTTGIEPYINLSKYYVLNISAEAPELKFILSSNDITYNDSVIKSAINSGQFDKTLKKWRSAKILYNNQIYKIKYKFHGTHAYSYSFGYVQLKIKSKKPIQGRDEFVIRNSSEANYVNIFLNTMGQQYGLYSEDPGEIISGQFYKTVDSYHVYESLKSNYFTKIYGSKIDYIFTRKGDWHTSGHTDLVDQYYYAFDEPLVDPDFKVVEGLEKFKQVKENNYEYSNSQKHYLGKFLSLLYLFGHPHQISGDNDKWILSANEILPLYRNEGHIEYFSPSRMDYDQNLFSIYRPNSQTYNVYMNLMIDNDIRHQRNVSFYNLINNSNNVIALFDSLYKKYSSVRKDYSRKYLYAKINHKKYRDNLVSSIDKFKQYININEVHMLFQNDTLKIVSDSYVEMDLYLDDEKYRIQPRIFKLVDTEIVPNIIETVIRINSEISDITLINTISGDTISDSNINVSYVN